MRSSCTSVAAEHLVAAEVELAEEECKKDAVKEPLPPGDTIQFQNPFPIVPDISIGQILGASLSLVEATRWSHDLPLNMLEIVFNEIENSSRLLYLSTPSTQG
jgi:hypothetical protein